jgi:predicted membrane protein
MADEPRSGLRITPQAVIGLLIVAWGLLLTAGNVGWLDPYDVQEILRFWPLLLVAFGVTKILSTSAAAGRRFGGILVAIGLWLTAGQVFAWRIRTWDLWPLILVVIGFNLISRAMTRSEPAVTTPADAGAPQPFTHESAWTSAEFALWSGIKRRVASSFKRADLTAIMGGIELDLRPAATAGAEAVIDVFVLWGGIEITVPPDWAVVNRIVPIMASVDDRSTGTQASQHRLVLRGFVLMGGVEIKT